MSPTWFPLIASHSTALSVHTRDCTHSEPDSAKSQTKHFRHILTFSPPHYVGMSLFPDVETGPERAQACRRWGSIVSQGVTWGHVTVTPSASGRE